MSMTGVQESGMTFPVEDTKTFFIEQSPFVSSLSGLQKCEFATITNGAKIQLVEAKTSFSKPDNSVDFEKNVGEIVGKYKDSLSVINAMLLRHPAESSIAPLKGINQRTTEYEFALVIKTLPVQGLPPVMDALKSKMKPYLKLWNVEDKAVRVFNESTARKFGLIK